MSRVVRAAQVIGMIMVSEIRSALLCFALLFSVCTYVLPTSSFPNQSCTKARTLATHTSSTRCLHPTPTEDTLLLHPTRQHSVLPTARRITITQAQSHHTCSLNLSRLTNNTNRHTWTITHLGHCIPQTRPRRQIPPPTNSTCLCPVCPACLVSPRRLRRRGLRLLRGSGCLPLFIPHRTHHVQNTDSEYQKTVSFDTSIYYSYFTWLRSSVYTYLSEIHASFIPSVLFD